MQPISNAMRRFDVCANNYQLFAHFRAATILLSTIMQKYLLLLVCFIVSMNVHAGITVVPPEESENGSYVLTFNNETANGTSIYDWNSLPDYVKNATAITIVTADEYTLSHADMVQIMGENSQSFFTSLQSLDMGDAVLSNNNDLGLMSCAKDSQVGNEKGLNHLKYFVFPKTTTTIPAGMLSGNQTIQEVIMLEPDKITDPHLTVIPNDAFKECRNLSNVRIPDGITEIQSGAFGHCAFDNISFPNTLTTIGPNAFEYCSNLKSVTIPYSVISIGNSAFQHNYSMTDVYVLGDEVEIKDGAFNQDETYNFKNHATSDIDFSDWEPQSGNGSTDKPLLLHIPNNPTATEHYVNPYLRMLNDPEMEELFDRVSEAYSPGEVQDNMNALFEKYGISPQNGNYPYEPFKREKWVEMPSVDGSIKKFFREAGNFFNAPKEVGASDYGGWRNFMLVNGDIDKKTWPDNRLIESRWYSAVFPFDMSYNQVMTTYGNGTDVREFTFVKQYKVNGKDKRTVCFNTPASIPAVSTMARSVDKNKAGYIVKGRPYMIHPGVRSEPIEVNGKTVYRTIAGVDVDAANAIVLANSDLETVYRNLVDADNNNAAIKENAYYFKGSYLKQDMPADCFYLGMWPDRPETLAFYVNTSVELDKWSAFTSVVQKSPNNTTESKTMDLDFKVILPFEEEMGIATRIDAVSMPNGKSDGMVYNLNGQAVRENNSLNGLNKGIYVVNGKKIVVR